MSKDNDIDFDDYFKSSYPNPLPTLNYEWDDIQIKPLPSGKITITDMDGNILFERKK